MCASTGACDKTLESRGPLLRHGYVYISYILYYTASEYKIHIVLSITTGCADSAGFFEFFFVDVEE